MARTRAVLTETERDRISGEGEDQRRYEAVSRVRSRIRDELPKDVECLQEHHPDLLEELRDVICEEPSEPDADVESSSWEPATPEDHAHAEEQMNAALETTEESDVVDFEALDLPGSGDTLRRRQEAVRTAYEFLREKGQAKAADVREHTWENSQTGYSDANSMWKNCVIKGLKQVAEQDEYLYPPGEGEHTWVHGAQFQ